MSENVAMVAEFPVLPVEPGDGSVVLDERGRAWQRVTGWWVRAGGVLSLFGHPSADGQLRWHDLLRMHGPVRVIHLAEVKA